MNMREFLELEHPEMFDFTEEKTSDNYRELQDLERFFAYIIKFRGKNCCYENVKEKYAELNNQHIFENLVDPDSKCSLVRNIYALLWDEKYLDFRGYFISGETMNSANTTFNKYVKFLPYDKLVSGNGILGVVSLYYADNEFKKYLDNSKNLVNFINVYHTIGNFIPFPDGCNSPRGFNNKNIEDYWDLTLKYIYDYYHGDETAIQNIYANAKIEKKFKDWLDKFGKGKKSGKDKWVTFIEKNYMSPFVENGNGTPKELWEGHFSGAVLPDTSDKCNNEYFKNASKWISERGELMLKALRKRISETEEKI